MRQFSLTVQNTKLKYYLILVVAGALGCTAAPDAPGGCQIVDIKNDAPTPFAHVNPQSFGDLVKLAREYPERKLLWCEDGYFAPYID
tara:strand:+ start:184 stop:444 length:261 start_codon:yes stop_codon:yes gene_type:complete